MRCSNAGSPHRLVYSLRQMTSKVEVTRHQLAGIGGHQTGGPESSNGGQMCPGDVWQLTAVVYINEPGGTGLMFVPTGKVGIALALHGLQIPCCFRGQCGCMASLHSLWFLMYYLNHSRTSWDHSSSTLVAKAHLGTRLTRVGCGTAPALGKKLLMHPKLLIYHHNLQVLRLHAWRLPLKALYLPEPRRRTWLKELHIANSDGLPRRFMIEGRKSFSHGAPPKGFCAGTHQCSRSHNVLMISSKKDNWSFIRSNDTGWPSWPLLGREAWMWGWTPTFVDLSIASMQS